MSAIDQQTRRRMARTGLVALDEERACPGYVLFTPLMGLGTAYLIDLKGQAVHRWNLPYPPGLYGYLLPNNNLFYMGKMHDETWDLWPHWHIIKGGVFLEVDWEGNIVWEHRDPYHHHDARRTSSGGVIYLNVERVPADIAAKVKGGVPDSGENGMWADVIIEVDAAGNRTWEWHAIEHLDFETDVLPPNVSRDEWTHGNAVVPLGEDRVMFSFRHISVVGIIDKKSGELVWKLGRDILSQQHDPSMLDNGNVLIFDNGPFPKYDWIPFSRVIEVDPKSNQIVWEYRDSPMFNFFSPNISGARRLSNGNTLITEGAFGRIFQVTLDKQVVWEYINPHFFEGPHGLVNSVFRALHYSEHEVPICDTRRH